MSTKTFVKCATIGCPEEATVRITHGPWDDRSWDDVCDPCAESYARRPALRVERIGAPFVCPREGVARGYVVTIQRGARGTGPGGAWRMGDPGGVDVLECKSCGQRVPR